MSDLTRATWPLDRAPEALDLLARRAGLVLTHAATAAAPPPTSAPDELEPWLRAAARRLGVEAEAVEASYRDAAALVRHGAPALLLLPVGEETRLLALLRCRGTRAEVLGSDLALHPLPVATVVAALRQPLDVLLATDTEALLVEAGVPRQRLAQARATLLTERLGQHPIRGGWLLRLSPAAPVWAQVRAARLPRWLLLFAGSHALSYGLWLAGWAILGQAALGGQVEGGWLVAWALLLLTMVPLRLLATQAQGWLAIRAGALLKQRLLFGALRLEPDEVRHQGSGHFLGQVIESEAVESLALSAGLLSLVALIELAVAAWVLASGAGGQTHALALLGWLLVAALIGWRFVQHRRRWTHARLAMTHDLVERMVGHRTRLAQQAPDRWHEGEDEAAAHTLERAAEMDRVGSLLLAPVARGWLLLGFAALAPALLAADASPAALAVAVGGILLAYQALERLSAGLWGLVGATIAWEQVAPLFRAAARPQPIGSPPPASRPLAPGQTVLDAHGLTFRYRAGSEPVLRGCTLRLRAGDKLLVEGPSGGGKSTLAALLVGLRQPESGLLLLRGLDPPTLGTEGWRRGVAAAPQFHENHVFTETFAFNLLMGRVWPPAPGDLDEAETLCHELGLGDLLARMPAGMLQMVGESGWQLSHGEQSRLFIARALLQGAEVIVLDESFAALDPATLRHALTCVLARAPTLIVIAHP